MSTLSKTARASMQAGEGSGKKTAVAWVFERKVGKQQTSPYKTFYVRGEAEQWLASLNGQGEKYFLVTWEGGKR